MRIILDILARRVGILKHTPLATVLATTEAAVTVDGGATTAEGLTILDGDHEMVAHALARLVRQAKVLGVWDHVEEILKREVYYRAEDAGPVVENRIN